MKTIKGNILKIMVVAALFCSSAFAGDMGSGGFAETGDVPVKTTEQSADGDMGSGGRFANSNGSSYLDTVFNSIYLYFDSMM